MEKFELLKEILLENEVPLWLLYSDEGSDPIFSKYICDKTVVACCCLLTPEKGYLLVNELDYDNCPSNDYLEVIKYDTNPSFLAEICRLLENLNFPKAIFLSYSTMNDQETDLLGHGTYCYLTEGITEFYCRNQRENKYASAEKVIYSLFDRKSDQTKERMTVAADYALDILEEAFLMIKEGMTELDLANLVHSLFERKQNDTLNDVVKKEYAWEEALCPIVLVGPSLEKGGHALPSVQSLERGMTVYFDFGVTLTYYDGEKVSSDLQRMGYFLKEGESEAPSVITKVFGDLKEAVTRGIQTIKPGIKGYEVDQVVRDYIVSCGYPSYNHSTGHAIGEKAHNPGTLLGKKGGKLSHLEVQKSGVYTIEPRISIKNGGSIEEMVFVSPQGGIPISKRQMKLFLIS